VVLSRRRLHDLCHPGWWAVLVLLPYLNTIFWQWMVFGKGDDFRNEYGPRPAENSKWIIGTVWFIPGLVVLIMVTGLGMVLTGKLDHRPGSAVQH